MPFRQKILFTVSKLIMFVTVLVSYQTLCAQKQNSKWYLGNGAALDFSTGVPVAIPGNSSFISTEGLAAVSDKTSGAILFYSNGLSVYNAANAVMPNGNGLLGAGNTSSTQGAMIAPKPGSNNLYYLFTSDETFGGAVNGIRYSVIDMSLNGGLGDVVAGQKNILLASNSTERLCLAVKPDSNSFWLMTHDRNSNLFRAFEITTAGINTTAVVSAVGLTHTAASTDDDAMGSMKFNHQYNKIAVCLWQSQRLQVLDFNNCTGVVSNPITINAIGRSYGVQFSPNGNLLYYSLGELGGIIQLNLLAGSQAAINASATVVGVTSSINESFGSLELGPDNKIYAAVLGGSWISSINNPNVLGVGCGYSDISTNFLSGISYFGLPQYVPLAQPGTSNVYAVNYAETCLGNSTRFSLSSTVNIQSIAWNFGDPSTGSSNTAATLSATHIFSAIGTYTVRATITTTCSTIIIDRIVNIVNCNNPNTIAGIKISGDTCTVGTPVSIQATGISSSPYFSWNFGDPSSGVNNTDSITGTSPSPFPVHTFSGPGTYNVCVSFKEPGFAVSTVCRVIKIGLCIPCTAATISGNLFFCTGSSTALTASAGSSYVWSTGATTQSITVNTPGNYAVTVTQPNGCSASANVNVTNSSPATTLIYHD